MDTSLSLRRRDLLAAAHAWQAGGTQQLSAWLAHYKPRFSVADYAALVALVRAELGDDHDYSKE